MGKSYSVDRCDSEGVGETLKDFATYRGARNFVRKHLVINRWDGNGDWEDSTDFYEGAVA